MTVATDESADQAIDESTVLRARLRGVVGELDQYVDDLVREVARRIEARGERRE